MRRCLVCLCLLTAAVSCTVMTDGARQAITTGDDLAEPVLESTNTREEHSMEDLARIDPVAFIKKTIDRYDREVRSYRVTLEKQERVRGTLYPVEVVDCYFVEEPFSVRMDWVKGERLAKRTAFVRGQYRGNVLVLGASWRTLVGVVERDPNGADAKASSRFPITEFGLKVGAVRSLKGWGAAKERGELHVEFGGVKELEELGHRPAWELKRIGFAKPEEDGVTEATLYFDVETWLQTGARLTGEGGKLIASYYFRDVELNAEFVDDTFTRAGLAK